MALKQEDVHLLLWPNQGNKIEGVVLNRVCILGFFFVLNRGQGFKPSAAYLYPNIGRVPPGLKHDLITVNIIYSVIEQ